MEILEAYDLTGSYRAAAELAGCDHHTVRRYVQLRAAGTPGSGRQAPRPRAIDEHLAKIEEMVENSRGRVRADKVHDRLRGLGFKGGERTTRRAVAAAKQAWRAGHRRVFRPWITEPGLWLQWDWGEGPRIKGKRTFLWCAWLAWSRFRVVLPTMDKTMPTVIACLDTTLRRLGGVPVYALTDNEKTVTTDHVARIAVRNPLIVDVGRHYGLTIRTCVPADPQTKGGVRGDGPDRQGRPRADGGEPARPVPHVRGVGDGLPGVLRRGQHPRASRDPPGPGRGVERGTAAVAPAAAPAVHRRVRPDPTGPLGRHRGIRRRPLLGSPPADRRPRLGTQSRRGGHCDRGNPRRASRSGPPRPGHTRATRRSTTSTTRTPSTPASAGPRPPAPRRHCS